MMRRAKKKAGVEFRIEDLKEDILREARLLKIDNAMAEMIAENVVQKTVKWVEKRVTFTQNDLYKHVATIIQQYSDDLAYVYQNRGKII